MKILRFFAVILSVFATLTSVCAQQKIDIPQYGKFESSFSIPKQMGNPFDPADNDVIVSFRTPSKKQIRVPAFWDGKLWRVRFTPDAVGQYELTAYRNGVQVPPSSLSASEFVCIRSDSPGFITRDPKHIQRFIFSNGAPYYPIGIDVAWQGAKDPGYGLSFEKMKSSGMNWARIWMTFWDGKALEWGSYPAEDPQPGYFLTNAADYWDRIFDLADKNGVYVQMTLQHHGQYTNRTDPNWKDNPYNTANGGFLKNPDDFFADPRAIRLTKAKYRYIIARWGYSPHIASFELFNEVQNITEAASHFQDVQNWHREMADYIRSIDPYRHPITSSYSEPGNGLDKVGLDYLQAHVYVGDTISAFKSLCDGAPLSLPLFVGEWGAQNGSINDEATLKRGLWAGIASPFAGAPEYWYWDAMDKAGGWDVYRSASLFLNKYNVPQLCALAPLKSSASCSLPRVSLIFGPSEGWKASDNIRIVAEPSGEVSGVSGAPSFIQGQWHRDMQKNPYLIQISPKESCRFILHIGKIAQGGAHVVVALDNGAASKEADYEKSNSDRIVDEQISMDVPAGLHTISLSDTGADWVVISSMEVTNYVSPLDTIARASQDSAVFWVYDRTNGVQKVDNALLKLEGLAPGQYDIHFWNTTKGSEEGTVRAVCGANRQLKAQVLGFDGDIAGVAIRRK